jgi:PleD family two-component response regulator
VTASFGVGHVYADASLAPDVLLAATDRALYAAKHRGRNCIVLGDARGTEASAGVLAQAGRAA